MNDETKAFISAHANDDVRQLALKKAPEGVDLKLAINQIDGRQRATKKLPSLAAIEGIVYPPHVSMEQCSSEQTALYKAGIARRLGGDTLVDLTGGFGIDFIYMSRGFKEATYVERQEHLCEAARDNFALLKMANAKVVNGDGVDYLNDMQPADIIYLDPARRDFNGARLFDIRDYSPNVLDILPTLKKKARHIIIKISPMCNWQRVLVDLGNRVSEVHVVSVANECKELLMVVEDGSFAWPMFYCVNIGAEPETYVFDAGDFFSRLDFRSTTMGNNAPFSLEQSRYLFVPNASVMKSMFFPLLSEQFSLPQVAAESHFYLSDHEVEGFPGKCFAIESISTMNKRELRQKLSGIERANIATRNFPLSTDELRRRLKLADGGDTYIFATTTAADDHILFICRKAEKSL